MALRNRPVMKCLIEKLSHDGRGLAHIDGKVTFVEGALAGETVTVERTRQKISFDEAHVVEVNIPSNERQEPPCPHFGTCGGCHLQHMPADMQISIKTQALQELITHHLKHTPTWLAPLLSHPMGYRSKARLSAKWVEKKDKVVVGFRERKGRYVADVSSCAILDPRMGHRIGALASLLTALSIKDKIPQIEVSTSNDVCILIVRHLAPLSEQDRQHLLDFCRQNELVMYLQPQGPDSIVPLDKDQARVMQCYKLTQSDIQIDYQPTDFTQINQNINQQMVVKALDLLTLNPTDQVLDLFCGIGNFTLPIARQVDAVVGIEGSDSAVSRAQHNAQINKITNAQFFSCDLFEEIQDQPWALNEYSKILLDPPRTGAQHIVTHMKWQPQCLVYISCNPSTFVRDAKILEERGYILSDVGVMDMFPHTKHIEVIGRFQPKKRKN